MCGRAYHMTGGMEDGCLGQAGHFREHISVARHYSFLYGVCLFVVDLFVVFVVLIVVVIEFLSA
jgi:hypothetical protein